ncbi:MAG: hypothetical protein KF868_04735 [Acidobacteria bacterium]|nr:hypothetical protein [Acidobacteriota bacterium]MCW5970805.1 hypothetical protein [Blastocatellales bacterium]
MIGFREIMLRKGLGGVLLALFAVPAAAQFPEMSAAEREAEGIKLLRAVVDARGGDRYLNFKTLVATGQYTPFDRGISTIPISFEDTIVYPDRERVEFGRGKKKDRRIQVNTGDTGWSYNGDAEVLKDQTPDQTREFLENLEFDPDRILRGGWQSEGVRVRFAGREETRPGERADVVEVELTPERKVVFAIDRFTRLPISMMYEKPGEKGLVRHEYRFFQYVVYDGVKFPNIVDYFRDGVQVSRINYQGIKLNVQVSEAIFAKPANVKAIK